MYEHILLDKEPPLARLTLNQPDKRNAMTPAMGDEVLRAVDDINADPAIRAVIITGAGKVFSAGGDLSMILKLSEVEPEKCRTHMLTYYRKYLAVQDIAVPTIAMLNGHAIGAGLCLAMACDLRTMARGAKAGLTFARVGLSAGMGSSYLLPRLVGLGPAAEMVFTGELITAEQAQHIGLVNRVCPAEELAPQTLRLAQSIAANAPLALRHTKRCLLVGASGDLDHVLDCEAEGQALCYQTKDIHEGVDAVRQRRRPAFRGE